MAVFKLLAVFAITFSLAVLQGPLTSQQVLPIVPLGHASLAPVERWYPAGPAMDTLVYKIYVDENAEFTGLQNGEIDLSDWPLTPALISTLNLDPNFFVTAPISDTGYFELQFHLGANFWGCQMNFGNSACGRDIRQAFAHSLDKTVFTSTQAAIAGVSVPIDNPVPPAVDLVFPNPCSWDATHVQTGSNCVVGEGGTTGGVAYHLAQAVSCNTGGSCPSVPSRLWTPGLGTPDFCAAADHFIAAGLATGKVGGPGTGTCVLTGLSSAVAANPVNIFARSDNNPRLQGGLSVAEFICALLTGAFMAGCNSAGLTVTTGPFTNFPCEQCCTLPTTTCCSTVCQSWNVYTGGFGNVPTFDSSLYFTYESRFVSGIPSIKPPNGPCDPASVGSFDPPNYMYLCDQTYDSLITQAEFSPCLSAPGDPTNGQVVPTFANCVSAPTKPSAKSASYQAQDEFGKNAFTVPWWSGRNQFGYKSNWSRVVLHKGDGFTPPGGGAATFNAYSATPALPGTVRQGFKEPPTSANPFVSNTVWDAGLTGSIWDSPNSINPDSPQSTLDWMTISTQVLQNNQLTYVPAPGTIETFRYTFRNDIFWQTGQMVTAWDAAFSYIAFKATGVVAGTGLAPMVGVKVLSPTQMDVNLNAFGPFTQLFLSTPILPGRFWSTCSPSTWDAGASNRNFAMANAATTPCIGPNTTGSGVILPTGTAVDTSKIMPAYDPIASGIFVGSGPWVCKSSGGVIGSVCSSTGTQSVAPGGVFTLQRYGFGTAPGTSLNTYFRSSGNLALWAWSGDTGDFARDFLNFSVAAFCFGSAPSSGACNRWTMGIGNPTGSSVSPAPIGVTQIGIIQRFVGINWVSPYDWVNAPPQGIASFPPVLYEGSVALNPASLVGCTNSFNNGGGYDC